MTMQLQLSNPQTQVVTDIFKQFSTKYIGQLQQQCLTEIQDLDDIEDLEVIISIAQRYNELIASAYSLQNTLRV